MDGCGKSGPLCIRSSDLPARSESLSRLSHHGIHYLRKGKAIPIEAWTGPEVSKSSRLTDFIIIGT